MVMMDMFENILWLAIGFIPTYAAMELAWKVSVKRSKIKSEKDKDIEAKEMKAVAGTPVERQK
jgi:DsbC/DsbD-like thiol-disulfide interchange protein